MKLLILGFILVAAPFLCAEGLVGKDAPAFSATSTVNATDFRQNDDFAGDVVVLRFT
ncbi:MAG: hypothetical protein ACYTDT_04350 [Planctomycetota bacterium]|jgi:hypothetical protein